MFLAIIFTAVIEIHLLFAVDEGHALRMLKANEQYPAWAQFYIFSAEPSASLADTTKIATITSTLTPHMRRETGRLDNATEKTLQ